MIVSKPANADNWVVWTGTELDEDQKAEIYQALKEEGGTFNNMKEMPDFIWGDNASAQGMTVTENEEGWYVVFEAPSDHALLWKGTFVCPLPEVTEPEVTEPEVTEPEVTEPEVTEPEVTEPEVTEPEVTEPEVTEPEVTEPEITEPGTEVTEPETEAPKTEAPKTDAPKTEAPKSGNPVTGDAGVLLPLLLSGFGVTGVALLERKRRK